MIRPRSLIARIEELQILSLLPIGFALAACCGCGDTLLPGGDVVDGEAQYDNSTDPTNRSARYVGTGACQQCHEDIADQHTVHGHSHKLTAVQGGPPEFPEVDPQPVVAIPPEGFDWTNISYVIGGYTKKARFIDLDGFILTNGVDGVNTQWNLPFPANGTVAGFVPYEASRVTPKPYDFACFTCHTTGALPQDEDNPRFQEGRLGFAGTWREAGVQCEECHGPGGNHFTTVSSEVRIDKTAIFVDTAADRCGRCHTRGDDPKVIIATNGFINHHEQWPELLASGGHASLDCTMCHNAHVSPTYDRDNAVRNECSACHEDKGMAQHADAVYQRDGYEERVTCASCHMPFATRSGSSGMIDVVDETGTPTGDVARIGDTKTHIFRINTDNVNSSAMFAADGASVATDAEGRAAVTVDYVCLRCHNGTGNVFGLTGDRATEIALNMHRSDAR